MPHTDVYLMHTASLWYRQNRPLRNSNQATRDRTGQYLAVAKN